MELFSNLALIKEFVNVFEKFIADTTENNKKENIHCNNFKVNLESKMHILLEYNKFYNKLEELISYFVKCTDELKNQLKNQKLLSFQSMEDNIKLRNYLIFFIYYF